MEGVSMSSVEHVQLTSGLLSAIVEPDQGRSGEYRLRFVLCTLQQERVDLTDNEAMVLLMMRKA